MVQIGHDNCRGLVLVRDCDVFVSKRDRSIVPTSCGEQSSAQVTPLEERQLAIGVLFITSVEQITCI